MAVLRSRRRGRHPAHSSAVLGASGIGVWFFSGEHGGLPAAGLLVAAGALLGVLWPLLALFLLGLPGGLVPRAWRAWWRRGMEDRPAIFAWLKRAVLAADGYRCCYCRNTQQLQVDHVFPWSLGGRSVFWNLMTLCGPCNRVKSNYWERRGQVVCYRPFPGQGHPARAQAILRKEKRRRLSPLRAARAAIALM